MKNNKIARSRWYGVLASLWFVVASSIAGPTIAVNDTKTKIDDVFSNQDFDNNANNQMMKDPEDHVVVVVDNPMADVIGHKSTVTSVVTSNSHEDVSDNNTFGHSSTVGNDEKNNQNTGDQADLPFVLTNQNEFVVIVNSNNNTFDRGALVDENMLDNSKTIHRMKFQTEGHHPTVFDHHILDTDEKRMKAMTTKILYQQRQENSLMMVQTYDDDDKEWTMNNQTVSTLSTHRNHPAGRFSSAKNVSNQSNGPNRNEVVVVFDNKDMNRIASQENDFPTIVDHHNVDKDNKGSILETYYPNLDTDDDDKQWMMTKGFSRSHDIHRMKNQTLLESSPHHHNFLVDSSSNKLRSLASCVTSATALKMAVKRGDTQIRVCSPRIKLGSLHRRRIRRYLLSTYNATNVTLTGLAGGINLSNLSIALTCLLKKRCILDGEGISRIFYGTNTTLMIEGFQFLNASTVAYDDLGSGSALGFIGSSHIVLKDCSFRYNTARYGGGAVMISDSILQFRNSHRKIQFYKNGASYGGAIFGINNATIQTNITSMGSSTSRYLRKISSKHYSSSSSEIITFQENYASMDGGAVHVTGGAVNYIHVSMQENNATTGGAAVLIDVDGIMTNISMSGNTANITGGALVVVNSTVLIVDSTFESNNAVENRGGVSVFTSNVSVTSSAFLKSCWSDGSICINGTTCDLCCNNVTYWILKQFTACGKEQSWSDGRICGEGTSCLLCSNGSEYWYSKAFTACGHEPCWEDGRYCAQGADGNCNACCNTSTYWFSKAFTSCGKEPCWVDGRLCANGTNGNCDACCNNYTYYNRKTSNACGSCWSDGTICTSGTTCNLCCNTESYWYSKGSVACGAEPCWEDGRTCIIGTNGSCNVCCNQHTYWDTKMSNACGSCRPDGMACVNGTTCDLCCQNSTYWYSRLSDACGIEPCYVDGTPCTVGTSCTKCCSPYNYFSDLSDGNICGCWPDGTPCVAGSSCSQCCNSDTYWSSKATQCCGIECIAGGTKCIMDVNCDTCCNGYDCNSKGYCSCTY